MICWLIVLIYAANPCLGKIIDLTHDFDNTTTVYWPSFQQYRFKLYSAGGVDNNTTYYESNRFCATEHGGTHMDAPRHFAKGTHGVNEVPLERLIGNAYVLDVSSHVENNKDFQVEVSHIEEVEKELGQIPDHSILLVYTGFSKYWPDLNLYLGTNTTNTSILHFPGLHPDAARWLVENRKIKSLGIDTASLDYGQSTTFQSHVILLKENIPGFENVNMKPLADEKLLKSKDFQIYALPIKIKDGSGAPLRIIAVTDSNPVSSATKNFLSPMLLLFLIASSIATSG